jgi:hypothetical protein
MNDGDSAPTKSLTDLDRQLDAFDAFLGADLPDLPSPSSWTSPSKHGNTVLDTMPIEVPIPQATPSCLSDSISIGGFPENGMCSSTGLHTAAERVILQATHATKKVSCAVSQSLQPLVEVYLLDHSASS